MKRRHWIILGIIFLAVLAGFWYSNDYFKQQKVSFKTVTIQSGDISMKISASGTLNATNTVEVGTQVSGVIEKVNVDFNDRVKKGQVIAQIDTRNLASTLEQKKAAVLQSKLQYEQKKRIYNLAKKYNAESEKDLSIVEAEASLEQIKAQLELAQQNFERYTELYKNEVVSKVEFENRTSDYNRLKANYEAVKTKLQRTKANAGNVDIEKSYDDVKIAEANLISARADLNKAKINLDYAIIRAPIDGIVISRNAEVGQTVAASFQTPVLFTIANDLTKMEIEASIDEADIGVIALNQPVVFSVDAYLDEYFSGKVEQIRLQPKVISNVVTYTVIVSTANEDLRLMPGMTANLDVLIAERKSVLKVPVTALNFSPPNEYSDPWRNYLGDESIVVKTSKGNWKPGVLWKVQEDKLVPKKVKVGLSDGFYTEIESAEFAEGDEVVVGLTSNSSKEQGSSNPFIPSRPSRKKDSEDK